MRTTTAATLAAATVAAVAAGTLPLVTAGAAPESAGVTMHLVAHNGSQANIDEGKKGFSGGDYGVFGGRLTQAGTFAGHLSGTCLTTVAGKRKATQLCTFVLALSGGQIIAEGAVGSTPHGPGAFTLAITGGTGKFGTARGVVKVKATNGSIPIEVDETS